MAEVGFILVGMLIGACLVTLMSLWIYHQSCPNYTERETGIECWHEGVPRDWRRAGAGSDCLRDLARRF